tara:strand:+ start:385 stop:1329 length:945 start_codon:yes stop_codon:yes gene_type:complete
MSIISTYDLVKDYNSSDGTIKALDGLNLEIPKGATALLGPNGSGKSTFIKIILGLLNATSGSYSLFSNKNSLPSNNYLQYIGYMPETPSIISKVNAVKYVRHFGILSGLSFTRAMQRAHEVLDYVGLKDRYRDISDFSTGMKQRLLFAQSLIHDPQIIILDEPTSGLSPEGRDEMLSLISEINKEFDKSILFSTHILQDVTNITNYSILINKGRTIFQGSPKKIEQLYNDTLIIEIDNHHNKIIELINSNEYNATIIGNKIEITTKTNAKILPSFAEFRNLIKSINVNILSFKMKKPDLEDLFYNNIVKDIDEV